MGTRSPAATAGAWGGRTTRQSACASMFSIELSCRVKGVTVKDDTTIEFDLEIAVDAPLGNKIVVVSWNDPPQTLSSDSE